MNDLSVSIIIPVHQKQNREILKACLESILRTAPSPNETILVYDGEEQPLPDAINTSDIIRLATNRQSGPSIARNLGAAHATGALLCFIDSDIVVPANLVSSIQEEFRKNQATAAIFGSYDAEPFMPNFLSQYRNLLHHYVHQTSNEEAFTFWTGCGAIRRDIFLELGGFDGKRFPEPSIEDIELGYRLKRAGYSIRLCKHLQVKHLKKWEAFPMVKVDFFHRALPWTLLLLEEKVITNDLNLTVSHRLSVGIIFLSVFLLFSCIWNPFLSLLLIPGVFVFLILNYKLYCFFFREKGWWFTLKVIPWHSIFYLTGGMAFALGSVNYFLMNKNP